MDALIKATPKWSQVVLVASLALAVIVAALRLSAIKGGPVELYFGAAPR